MSSSILRTAESDELSHLVTRCLQLLDFSHFVFGQNFSENFFDANLLKQKKSRQKISNRFPSLELSSRCSTFLYTYTRICTAETCLVILLLYSRDLFDDVQNCITVQ